MMDRLGREGGHEQSLGVATSLVKPPDVTAQRILVAEKVRKTSYFVEKVIEFLQ
jgi:hypothetical protein